jgi:hypothetical protein
MGAARDELSRRCQVDLVSLSPQATPRGSRETHVKPLIPLAILPALALTLRASIDVSAHSDERARCTLAPGSVRAVLRVEQDTMLPLVNSRLQAMSFSTPPVRPGAPQVAGPDTPMPSARVRLTRLDSATRVEFAAAGIRDSEPTAYIQARPYGADCRALVWNDTVAWVRRAEIGYIVATLAPREAWINNVPVLVIPETWNYPYPRQQGLLMRVMQPASGEPLATAEALFDFSASNPRANPDGFGQELPDSVSVANMLAWARAYAEQSEREPIRRLLRSTILKYDMDRIAKRPSRLRGSYRVTMSADDSTVTWWFRTVDKPAFRWEGPDSVRSTAELVRAPYATYNLVGDAADDRMSLAAAATSGTRQNPAKLVWLAASDRPGMPGNEGVRVLRAQLMFKLRSAPVSIWPALEAYIPPRSALDSAMMARMRFAIPREDLQPTIPLTLRLDDSGRWSADTLLVRNGKSLRVTLTQGDTVSVRRLW